MHRAGLTLSALLFVSPWVVAQAPPIGGSPQPQNPVPGGGLPMPPAAAAAPTAVAPELKRHLLAWEEKQKFVGNLHTQCEMVRKDLVFRKEKAYSGVIMCMKPNLAWLKIQAKNDPNDYVAYISNGKSVFEYDASKKSVTEHIIPRATPNSVGDNLLIEFMSGSMTADEVIRRFDLKLVKEEEYYVHILAKPRFQKDMQEFESLLLVLYSPKAKGMEYLPAVVVMRNNNGQSEEQWTFTKPTANAQNLTTAHFQYVKPPEGWEVKAAPQAGLPPVDPKVARPAGDR